MDPRILAAVNAVLIDLYELDVSIVTADGTRRWQRMVAVMEELQAMVKQESGAA